MGIYGIAKKEEEYNKLQNGSTQFQYGLVDSEKKKKKSSGEFGWVV